MANHIGCILPSDYSKNECLFLVPLLITGVRYVFDLSSTNMAIQDSLAKMWNLTDQLDNKLNKLQTNHTFVSGIFKTGLKDVVAKQDLFEIQLEQKILNKTVSLESAVGSLLNYTLDLDTNFMTLKANISMANRRIERVFELYEMQGKRVAENANVIKDNITNLSLAANILEAELSRVASSYAGLKNALSRHISNTGKETLYTKLVLMLHLDDLSGSSSMAPLYLLI